MGTLSWAAAGHSGHNGEGYPRHVLLLML